MNRHLALAVMEHKSKFTMCMYCGVPKDASQAEVMPSSEKS